SVPLTVIASTFAPATLPVILSNVDPATNPEDAVMVAVPIGPELTAKPVLLTWTKPEELQATAAVKFWVAPLEKIPVAVNCCDPLETMVLLAGVTAMETKVAPPA